MGGSRGGGWVLITTKHVKEGAHTANRLQKAPVWCQRQAEAQQLAPHLLPGLALSRPNPASLPCCSASPPLLAAAGTATAAAAMFCCCQSAAAAASSSSKGHSGRASAEGPVRLACRNRWSAATAANSACSAAAAGGSAAPASSCWKAGPAASNHSGVLSGGSPPLPPGAAAAQAACSAEARAPV